MKVYGIDGSREMGDELARTKNTMFDLAATVAELRIKVRELEDENADLRHRLDSLRPMLDRMGIVFTDAAELGLPEGVKGIDGTWQVPGE